MGKVADKEVPHLADRDLSHYRKVTNKEIPLADKDLSHERKVTNKDVPLVDRDFVSLRELPTKRYL